MNAYVDISDVVLDTERLILRPWKPEDLEDFFAYASVDGVGEMAGWAHHTDIDVSRRVLWMFIEEKKTFALELKETGQVIGSLGIEELSSEEFDEPELYGRELGYVLARDFWGRGLMPEAVERVIQYCFEVLHCDFLTCCHFLRNSRSRRVIEKAGFRFEKEIVYQTQREVAETSALYVLYHPAQEK